jgi:hypothetical protein
MSAGASGFPSWALTPGATPTLSLRQPWAWAILRAGKRLENRTAWRSCRYRGPIWLHAANWPRGDAERLPPQRADVAEYLDAADEMIRMARKARATDSLPHPTNHRLILEHRGGVVGRARVVDVVSGPIDLARAVRDGVITPGQSAWYMGGFALVLADVRAVPFVACRGALGLFGLPRDVEEALASALAEGTEGDAEVEEVDDNEGRTEREGALGPVGREDAS